MSNAQRIISAIVGGYVLTSGLAIVSALFLTALGMNDAEAVLAVTIASFPVYAGLVMALFYAVRLRR